MRKIQFHEKALLEIKSFARPVTKEIGEYLLKLQQGISIGMPGSKPMPSVHSGVHELRIRDAAGIYQVFYYLKSNQGILVFHAFSKKTQKTPQREIELGRKRLKELL